MHSSPSTPSEGGDVEDGDVDMADDLLLNTAPFILPRNFVASSSPFSVLGRTGSIPERTLDPMMAGQPLSKLDDVGSSD